MKGLSLFRAAILVVLLSAGLAPALAQGAGPTPQQLQSMISNGQERAALGDLKAVLKTHPHSGVAWYLTAEAEDASGNLAAARDALARAEHYSPGLPFAQPSKVAALKSHLATPVTRHATGHNPVIYIIVGLVALFILVRVFLRSRRRMVPPGYPGGYGGGFPGGPGPQGPYPYGPPGPGGAAYGRGSGIGGSILGGLAAGAGFAAGERIIEGLDGSRNEQPIDPGAGGDPTVPDRDDGLTGSPDWGGDQGGADDDFDPNNNW